MKKSKDILLLALVLVLLGLTLGVLTCVFFCRPDFVNGIIEIDFFGFVFEYLI